MSLHTLAHNLQSAGRGDDKVLVHMTPQEVSGLQTLAMAHGGSLTINPNTGLPEAGFLKRLLPMLVGGALTVMSGGALSPLMAAGLVGGGTALATGNLKKGLMAGLGAYGGAGFASGLSAAGAASQAATGAAAPSAANEALKQGIFSQARSNVATALPAAGGAANTGILASGVSPVATTTLPAVAAPSIGSVASTAAPSMTSNLTAGIKSLGQEGGIGRLYDALPKNTLPTLAGVLLSGMSDNKGTMPEQSKSFIRPYTYERTQRPGVYDMGAPMYEGSPGSSAERNYFNESYTAQTPILAPGPEYAAEGGLMGYAVGGPVEQMAALNAVGANTGYPMAGINTPMYANPMMQRPEAVNVISPSGDAGVTAYSGEPRFAGGGKTVAFAPEGYKSEGSYQYSYDPKTMQFTQTGTPTLRPDMSSARGWMAPAINMLMQQNAPTLNTGAKVSGGIAPPAMGPTPARAAQPAYVPPAIPEYQSPEQQLGLGNFYSMMNQQLAGLQGLGGYDGYAAGGYTRSAPLNAKMAAVDAARAKMQTRQGQMEMAKAARDGDYSAQLALQDAGYDLNKLNNYAGGGISHLGDYSDGGRLLKGPGDGVSDSIPAVIGERQPARLADGEFVVPARIVSELGNGSTEAGARKLYAMMDRVQKARGKTVGKGKVAANTRSERHLPA
jgi:hypothetical protein